MGSEEKAKKAMVDAARLADELRAEQDHVAAQTNTKRSLERQLADLESSLADANDAALRDGKSAIGKLESKIRELEIELGSVQANTSDNMKAFQRAERKIKELQFQNDEDIAALNLAKFRKAQQELEETEDRAKLAK